MKIVFIVLLGFSLVGGLFYYILQGGFNSKEESLSPNISENTSTTTTETEETTFPTEDSAVISSSTTNKDLISNSDKETVIGKSVSGTDIKAYHFGTGEKEILVIGGIHGGYSPNTVALNYELIDWLEKTPKAVPSNIKLTIIPVLNPDGLKKVTGTNERFTINQIKTDSATQIAGRFNAHEVDLNRNFACKWQAVGKWRDTDVSGGKNAFSEPESQAIKNYIESNQITAALAFYSAEGSVYSSSCDGKILTETKNLTEMYAKASKYAAEENFEHYKISGDMVDWLASKNIPAISILLTDHKNTEFNKNQIGLETIMKYFNDKKEETSTN